MFGRSKPRRKIAAAAPRRAGADDLGAGLGVGGRGQGHVWTPPSAAAQLAEQRGSRAGSRGPIGGRNAPRRRRGGARPSAPARRWSRAARGARAPCRGAAACPGPPRAKSLASPRRHCEVRAPAATPCGAARDLVAHQRDQRRDDEGHAAAQQRRELVAERLAAAGRHDREDVLPRHHGPHDLLLAGAEVGEAEDGLEDGACVVHARTLAQLADSDQPPTRLSKLVSKLARPHSHRRSVDPQALGAVPVFDRLVGVEIMADVVGPDVRHDPIRLETQQDVRAGGRNGQRRVHG